MLFSFIVTTYNKVDLLKKCLNSIFKQTYKDFECVVVNDGSTDGTFEYLNQLKKTEKRLNVINQDNKGSSDALNVAIANSQGEYIVIVDHDDWIDEDLLYISKNEIDKHNHPDLISPGEDYYSLDGELISEDLFNYCFVTEHENVTKEAMKRFSYITHGGKCIKRNLFEKIEYVGNGFGADTVVMAFIVYSSKSYVYINKILYHRLADPNSLSRREQPPDIDLDFAERYVDTISLYIDDNDRTRWPIKELEGMYDHYVLFLKNNVIWSKIIKKRTKSLGKKIWKYRKICLPKRKNMILAYFILNKPSITATFLNKQ